MAKPRLQAAPLTRDQEAWLWCAALPTLGLHGLHMPYWLSALALLLLLWRAETWWQRRPLPGRGLIILLAAAGTGAVLGHYKTIFGREPGVALLMVFLALKMFEMRGVRDARVLTFLCYFLVFSLFFHSQAPLAAAAALAVVLVITAALASLGPGRRPPADHLRLAGQMLVQALPFMLVMFVLFPRVQGPLWGLPVDAAAARSGLSDTMSPGSISRLILSDEIAFRAKFADTVPPRSQLYWRGPVLDHFDGHTWRSVHRDQPLQSAPAAAAGPLYDYSVTLEPHNQRWLFALELPLRLPPDSALSSDYLLLSRTPVRQRVRYELSSATTARPGEQERPSLLQANLQLPPQGNPHARALAAQWRRELADDEAIARRMLGLFRDQAFVYTLQPPPLGQDGIDQFLFSTRRGFCEHYAGAFVFAMRAAGIPSRVVTGYQGGEINQADGYLTVRQSDAHAWAEVWLAGQGWVRVDPTAAIAPNRIEAGIASAMGAGEPLPFMVRADLTWLRQLRLQWEALSNGWNQWVLGYNPQRQREVLSRLGLGAPDWQNMTAVLALLCGVFVLAMLPWALYQRRRTDRALRAWDRLSSKLARRGLARRPWEGPRDYARRVAAALPAAAAEIEVIASLYIGLRYGSGDNAQALDELTTRVARFTIR